MQRLRLPKTIQWLLLMAVVFMVIMSVLRLALVLAFPSSLSFSELLPSFILGIRYDLRMVCIVCAIVFLLGLIPFLHPFKRKAGRVTAFVIFTLFSLVLCIFYAVDFANFGYLAQRVAGSLLNYLGDAMISLGMIWQTYHVMWLLLGLIVGIICLWWLIARTHRYVLRKKPVATKKSRIWYSIAFFLLLALGIFGKINQYPLRWSDAFVFKNDYKSQIALNPLQSFFSSIDYRHFTYHIDRVQKHYDMMADFLGVNHPDKEHLNFEREFAGEPAAKKPNIVLVICESFSAYKSSMVGNPLNTTPFFNQMTQNGIYFDRFFSSTYGTAKGVWAIVTGIPDVAAFETSSRNPATVDQHTIINDFDGYEKYYFIGGSTSWANLRGLLTNNINNLHLYEEGDYKSPKVDVWGISDKNLFLESSSILANEKKPFFAVVQTADNHRPYTIPKEDIGPFQPLTLPEDTLHKYGFESNAELNAFRYTDFTFQQLITSAKKQPYFNNTIFVFTGDHGIPGNAGNMLPKTFTEMKLTFEHVPFLIYAPGLMKPARYSYPASQVDILPTLAGLAKIHYTNTTLGRDLLATGMNNRNAAFIIDIDNSYKGFMANDIYYTQRFGGKSEGWGNITNNDPVVLSDSSKQYYRQMTDAIYQTATYMLFNNKKKNKPSSK